MADDDTGKKVGLVGAGLAGVLGLLAKMEHCVAAGGKVAAPAVHLAEDGARVGARVMPFAAEGAAVGAGVARPSSALARGAAGQLSRGGRVFSGMSMRAVPLAAVEDGARFAPSHVGTTLIERGAVEAASWTFDGASLLVDDESSDRNGQPVVITPSISGRSVLIALEPGAVAVDVTGRGNLHVLTPMQIHGLSGLFSAFPIVRRSSPFVIVGRAEGNGLRIPEGPPAPATAIASSCVAAGAVCDVVVCPADAAPICELAVANAWKQAAEPLKDTAREAEIVSALAAFQGRFLSALTEEPASRDVEVALVDYAEHGFTRVLEATRSRPTPPARSTIPALSASASPRARKR